MGGYVLNKVKYQYFVMRAKSLNNSISINTLPKYGMNLIKYILQFWNKP